MKQIFHIFSIFSLILLLGSCQKEEQLRISFTGDVLLDRGVRKEIERKGIDFLFEDVAPIFHASDAVVINLECPITDTISPIHKKYIFRADSEWTSALSKNGVTHAALANNHSMDQGRRGLESTYYHLINSGITPLGYGENQTSACQPTLFSKKGIEVALFNSVLLPLENWVYLEDKPGVCQATIEDLCSEIRQLKIKNSACYVLVVLHWGVEYQQEPTLQQRREARQLIDAGADGIIGHHPHVIQKEEIYKNKPIFYSLGNFIFDQSTPSTTKSVIVELVFGKKDFTYIKKEVKIEACKPIIKD